MDERGQQGVVDFLASPLAHGGRVPEHVTTHISHVFLAGDRALKLKRAVRLPFVDYSTLALREHFCRREVEINRAFAPDLYRGVLAVTQSGGGYRLGGDGPVADWVVEMARFDANAQFDRLLEAGRLDAKLAEATADMIAASHRAAPLARTRKAGEAVRRVIDQLHRDLQPHLGSPAARANASLWLHKASEHAWRFAGLIDRRGRHGFVRRCHADLHLSNICLWQGRPTPFDAIEFSDEMASIDVIYDLAFILVDLEMRDRGELASRLLSRYLGWTRDYSGLALLPLFGSMRAMVRALVGATKGRPAGELVDFARTLAERRPAPLLVAVGGFSGTGKSTLAAALAARIGGAVVVRSDIIHKHLHGRVPEMPLPAEAYGREAQRRVYDRLRVDTRRALIAGAPVIADATFLDADERARVEALAARLGVPFDGLWLDGPEELLRERLAARRGDASDADPNVLERQFAREIGPLDWHRIDAALAPESAAEAAEDALR